MKKFLLTMLVGILICRYMPQLAATNAGQTLKTKTRRALGELRKITQAVANRAAPITPEQSHSLSALAAKHHHEFPKASEALITTLLDANNGKITKEQLQELTGSIEKDRLGTLLLQAAGKHEEITKTEALVYLHLLEHYSSYNNEVQVAANILDDIPTDLRVEMFERGIDVDLRSRRYWGSFVPGIAEAIVKRTAPIAPEQFMSMLRYSVELHITERSSQEIKTYAGDVVTALLDDNGGKITKEQLQDLMKIRLTKAKLGRYVLDIADRYKAATTLEALVDLDFLEVLNHNEVEKVAENIGDLPLTLRIKLFERGLNIGMAGKSFQRDTP